MPVPRAQGYPDYSYDGGAKYIPILFAGKTLEKFYDASVVTNISNTDYVGQIKNVGDRVVIRTIPNITIRPYSKGATLQLEYPESPAIEFSVNRAKYYNFAIDDIDIKQMDMNYLDKFAEDASEQLKIVYDTEVLGTVYGLVDGANQGSNAGRKSGNINLGSTGSPVVLDKTNIIDKIIECGVVLDEQNVPETDRYIVLPPRIAGLIKSSELKQAYLTGDQQSILRSGKIGMIDRFTIYTSNLLSKDQNDDAYHIIFGHKKAMVFVAQLTKNELYRPQNTFANAMKGLVVYDFDIIHPTLIGHLYATIG